MVKLLVELLWSDELWFDQASLLLLKGRHEFLLLQNENVLGSPKSFLIKVFVVYQKQKTKAELLCKLNKSLPQVVRFQACLYLHSFLVWRIVIDDILITSVRISLHI